MTIVPLVVGGRCPAAAAADALGRLWGGDDTVLVVSSDLSHYLRRRRRPAPATTAPGGAILEGRADDIGPVRRLRLRRRSPG